MDFNLFSSQKNKEASAIFDDAGKVQEIKEKLCKKRADLEAEVVNIPPSSLTEYTLSLIELKKDMVSFGVSEIDYQIYLASQNEKEVGEVPIK
jgi:hypothetical protein